jgi:heterodisulfide reductase subunit A-like polyferredoxin
MRAGVLNLWEPEMDLSSPDLDRTDFDVIVLGAGVVGVNTAYWATRQGKRVCVIDREPEAGLALLIHPNCRHERRM